MFTSTMLNPVKWLWNFLNYWYFRYLMVTELYMVEKWERAVCNISIIVFFSLLSYVNYKILDLSGALWKPNSVDMVSYT